MNNDQPTSVLYGTTLDAFCTAVWLNPWFRAFVVLFFLRYSRLIVSMVAYYTSRAVPVPQNPTYTSKDVSVILPVEGPESAEFAECFRCIFANRPAEIFLVTTGQDKVRLIEAFCLSDEFPSNDGTRVTILDCPKKSKRERLVFALRSVKTEIVVQCDETVFWPSEFLPNVLAPFEDPQIGIVGTVKRVRRMAGVEGFAGFLNLCGVLRLERTNFDLGASHAVDGGCSCVSGRTCAWRVSILNTDSFIYEFTHETIYGKGPINAGDDKFITLWMINHGWKIGHQACPGARIETILGVQKSGKGQSAAGKFVAQLLRWARSSARDNPRALFVHRSIWYRHPWTTYAVFLTSFWNYAALWDPAMMWTLRAAVQDPNVSALLGGTTKPLILLASWICLSKLVKGAGHFWRYPADLRYSPFVVLFAYFHSFIKLYALITRTNIDWGSRAGVDEHKEKK